MDETVAALEQALRPDALAVALERGRRTDSMVRLQLRSGRRAFSIRITSATENDDDRRADEHHRRDDLVEDQPARA